MNRREHCKECKKKLGEAWDKVHAWLDATAYPYFPWMGHRQIRHHIDGVEEIRRMYGDEAAKAAELHIIADEGYIPTREQIKKKYGPSPYTEDNGEYPRFPKARSKEWDGVKRFN